MPRQTLRAYAIGFGESEKGGHGSLRMPNRPSLQPLVAEDLPELSQKMSKMFWSAEEAQRVDTIYRTDAKDEQQARRQTSTLQKEAKFKDCSK